MSFFFSQISICRRPWKSISVVVVVVKVTECNTINIHYGVVALRLNTVGAVVLK